MISDHALKLVVAAVPPVPPLGKIQPSLWKRSPDLRDGRRASCAGRDQSFVIAARIAGDAKDRVVGAKGIEVERRVHFVIAARGAAEADRRLVIARCAGEHVKRRAGVDGGVAGKPDRSLHVLMTEPFGQGVGGAVRIDVAGVKPQSQRC